MSESALDRVRRPDAMRVRTMGQYDAGYELPAEKAGKPDWIDFRASVGRAERRVEAGEVVSRCWSCRTELDVVVPVHSPRCRTLVRESDGRAALAAMDDGVPQRELDVQEVAASRDCATPRCAREADSGSDFCRVCDEGLRIAAERAGHQTAVPEPKREVETVRTSQRKWPRQAIIEAIRRWALEHGAPPTNDQWVKGALGRPTASTVAKEFGSWSAAIEAAGFDRPVRGGNNRSSVREPKVREASGHSSPAASSSPPLPEGDAVVPAVSPGPVPTEAEAGSRTDEHDEGWFARIGFDKTRWEAERDECSRLCDLYEMRRDMLDKALGAMEGLA